MLSCGELREAELKMDVSICGIDQGESLGEETKEEDLMNYWDSSEASEDVLTREADEVMQSFNFSHSLCMLAGCAKDGEQFDRTITKENETLEVNLGREFLSEKEGNDLSQQEEIINEFLLGVRHQFKVVMEQEKSENAKEKFRGGKQMYLFNEIADESF